MKYHARVEAQGDAENILKIFEAEDKVFKNKRSKYELKKEGEKVIFEIEAEDATALRSILDSIAKGLKIYEEMRKIK